MSRTLLHRLQGRIFSSRYTFLDYGDAMHLTDKLASEVEESGFEPEVIVSIDNGGRYPASRLGYKFQIPVVGMKVNHYGLSLCGYELDDIIGAYRVAKFLGYKPDKGIKKDVEEDLVLGKRVLLVDDDSYSGWTLDVATESIWKKKAADVKVGVMLTHSENEKVDFFGDSLTRSDFYCKRFRMPWCSLSPYYDYPKREFAELLALSSSVHHP